jgi:hypothetical protein
MPFSPHALHNKLMALVAVFFNYATNFMFTHCYIPLSSMMFQVRKADKRYYSTLRPRNAA